MRWLSHRVARLAGWSLEGEIPALPRMVIVGAPHTSNWDFFLFLAALHHFHIDVRFLGKHTLFRWPLGPLFRAVGGIPVDRRRPGGVVAQVEEAFAAVPRMILVVAPEGTRRAAPSWKSGFVEIASRVGVPVVLAGVDGRRRSVVIGPTIEVSGPGGLMEQARDFYAGIDGIKPAGKGPVRLARE